MGVIIEVMGRFVVSLVLLSSVLPSPLSAGQQAMDQPAWLALAKGGFVVPAGRTAGDMLLEMNALLASTDPVLRDDVAFTAAERWIVRDGRVGPDELRRLLKLWSSSLDDGLGGPADDRVFKRSFSALSLSLIASRELAAPFLDASEVQAFFDRMLDYFAREKDLRGFDTTRGWMHTVAHTADVLKFLSRNTKLAPGSDVRLLAAVRDKIAAHDAVFAWGENDRMALALQSAVRRPDANGPALELWLAEWVDQYKKLWAAGPQVDSRQFARVENARQVLRSLHAALSMEAAPTSAGDTARTKLLAGLAKMR
jgi:hypothetical protein